MTASGTSRPDVESTADETTPARRRVLSTLAVGPVYLRLAVALMHSARQVAGDRLTYVIFHGNCDPTEYAHVPWIEFVNLDPIVFARTDKRDLDSVPNRPRDFKGLPFVHEGYLDADMLFLDADSLVFSDRFDEIFKLIRDHSVVLFGTYTDDTYCHYNTPKLRFNLKEEAAKLGYNVRNMNVNSGFVGRSGDALGRRFGQLLDALSQGQCFQPVLGSKVANEPYVMLAFQLANQGGEGGRVGVPRGITCTTHGATLLDTESNWPDVDKQLSGEGVLRKHAILHFVGFRNFPWYLDRADELAAAVRAGDDPAGLTASKQQDPRRAGKQPARLQKLVDDRPPLWRRVKRKLRRLGLASRSKESQTPSARPQESRVMKKVNTDDLFQQVADGGTVVAHCTRLDLLRALPRRGMFCEVGVAKGGLSNMLLSRCRPRQLHLIDPWTGERNEAYNDADGNKLDQDRMDQRYRDVLHRFREPIFAGQVVIHRDYAVPLAPLFDDASFDFVYIDGNHSYEAVRADLEAYLPKVKADGMIWGHDYTMNRTAVAHGYGVVQAVNEFCHDHQLHLVALSQEYFPSYCIARNNNAESIRRLLDYIASNHEYELVPRAIDKALVTHLRDETATQFDPPRFQWQDASPSPS